MMVTNTVWVVDDERSIRWVLDKAQLCRWSHPLRVHDAWLARQLRSAADDMQAD